MRKLNLIKEKLNKLSEEVCISQKLAQIKISDWNLDECLEEIEKIGTNLNGQELFLQNNKVIL